MPLAEKLWRKSASPSSSMGSEAPLADPITGSPTRTAIRCSVVAVVYDATIVDGSITPDNHEVVEAQWFDVAKLAEAYLSDQTRTLFGDLDLLEAS